MTNQQILEKAIKKAIDGGWTPPDEKFHVSEWLGTNSSMFDNPTVKLAVWFDVTKKSFVGEIYHATDIIFDHDFARALWGSEIFDALPTWKWHLQQMVIAENPLDYLKENM